MTCARGQDGQPVENLGRGADHGTVSVLVDDTAVFRSQGSAGYGRHAAPLSAYGPADVGRLLPVPPPAPRMAAPARPVKEPVEAVDHVIPSEDREDDEGSTTTTGFWARLRLLPKAA